MSAGPFQTLRCRRLADVSPFAAGWTQTGAGPAETAETPGDALRRLHALLTGGGQEAGATFP